MNVRILYRGDEPLWIVPEEEFWELENPLLSWSGIMTRKKAEDVFTDWRIRPCGTYGDGY